MILTIALAAVCMVGTDIIATVMVQAEANYRRHLAAAMDTFGWWLGIVTTTISVGELQSHSLLARGLTLGAVGAANYYGTWLGVGIGAKIMHRETRAGILTRKAQPDSRSKPVQP